MPFSVLQFAAIPFKYSIVIQKSNFLLDSAD